MKTLKILTAVLTITLFSAFTQQLNPLAADGEKAPNFTIETVDNQIVSLKKSMKEEKPSVIYFTASWCPMCAKNWPTLSDAYEKYKDKVNIVAISIDPTDDATVMRDLSKERDIKFPVAAGDSQLMVDFGVDAQATTVGIDKNGNIAFKKRAVLSSDEFQKLFDSLL
jgi:peroxiredoxin